MTQDRTDYLLSDLPTETKSLGKRFDIINNLFYRLNIPFNLLHCSKAESTLLVKRAEEALIPWTISCNPQKKALGLIGRPNRPLFKGEVSSQGYLSHINSH